jgi:F-type H+-transporting ATPase subunit delta
MISELVARKYALALYRQFESPEQADKAWQTLARVAEALQKVPALKRFARAPQIEMSAKMELFDNVLPKDAALVKKFVDILLKNAMLDGLPAIVRALRSEIDRRSGVRAAQVSSAVALTDAQKKRLEKDLADLWKAPIRLGYQTEPALIGGVMVRTRDQVMDQSVRGRLERLRETLLTD